MSKIRKKKKRDAVYVCGLPHCNKRLVLPNHGEMVRIPHRDINGFRCNGMLLRYDLTEEGKMVARDKWWWMRGRKRRVK